MLTQLELKKKLKYDPLTGKFTWIVSNPRGGRQVAGATAGSLGLDGYIEIKIDDHRYKAHRLAWLYTYGNWPSGDLDHKNTIKDDNSLSNLREATHPQNLANTRRSKNNTSGFKGVSLHRKTGKWQSAIRVADKRHHLGLFRTKEEAYAAYCEASLRLNGEFARLV